jgi:hypothetical protein
VAEALSKRVIVASAAPWNALPAVSSVSGRPAGWNRIVPVSRR